MSLKDTNATLFNMLTDLEDEKISSSEEDENASSSISIENTQMAEENTQMADEKTSHLTVVDPLDNLLDIQAEATAILGSNTKTILSEDAIDEGEDIQQAALEEDSVFKENITFQGQKDEEEVQEDESSRPINNEESLVLLNERVRVIDKAEESHVTSLEDKTQAKGVITNSILQNNKGEVNLGLDTLSKFMEHAEDSASQSQSTHPKASLDNLSLVTPLDSSSDSVSDSSLNSSSSSEAYSDISSTMRITPSEELASEGDLSISAGVILKRADQFKIAQERIHDLENTVFNVRQENAELSSEIETLKKRIEELSSLLDSTERRNRTKIENVSDERSLLEESLFQKNKEYNNLKLKIEELKNRLAKDLKSVRVKEIELENRLELVKGEKTTLLKSKDEIILNLKRKTDHLIMDIDGYRKKSQLAQLQISENEERVQRSVRALRLALGMLEGNDSQ